MSAIDKKELLVAAINDYEPYTKGQRKMLSAFVNLAVNDVIGISVASIAEMLHISKFSIYKNLSRLEQDEIIIKISDPGARLASFRLNYNKLRIIEESYLQKQKYIAKN